MKNPAWWWLGLWAALAAACGGDASGPDGGVAEGGRPDGGLGTVDGRSDRADGASPDGALGCDPSQYCSADGTFCGVHAIPECGEVDCGPCRYGQQRFHGGAITAAHDRSIHLLYHTEDSSDALLHGVASREGIESEPVDGVTLSGSLDSPSIAVASDGTVHAVWVEERVMHGVRPAGGAWEVREATDGDVVVVALDGAGTPHLVVRVQGETRLYDWVHATPPETGADYDTAPLERSVESLDPSVATAPDGTVVMAMALADEPGTVGVFELVEGTFIRDTSVPPLDDIIGSAPEVVATSDGALHLAIVTGNYTLRTGSKLMLFSRVGGTWSSQVLASGIGRYFALAAGVNDSLHLLRHVPSGRAEGLYYTRVGSARTLRLIPEQQEAPLDMVIDAADQPHLLIGSLYMTALERFPAGYFEACEETAATVCARACECSTSECCYDTEGGSNGCSSSAPVCEENMREHLCGDLTADPSLLLACHSEVQSTAPMCIVEHYRLPAACDEII